MSSTRKNYSELSWFAEIPAPEGAYFLAIEVAPGTRLSQIEGAVRVFAPRTDFEPKGKIEERYTIVEGLNLPEDVFFFVPSYQGNGRPSWVLAGDSTMRPLGTKPCQMNAAVDIASGDVDGYRFEEVRGCRDNGHVCAYDSGWDFTRNTHLSSAVDYSAAKREFGEEAVREYFADCAKKEEKYQKAFVPKPCPACAMKAK